MNFSPKPSGDRRFFLDLCLFVKSWNARLDGREKYYHVGVVTRVMEALCRLDRVGSVTKPNCDINFFIFASMAVFRARSIALILI